MEKEIQDIIEKSLPKQVGDTLKKRIELVDELEKEIKRLKSEIEKYENNNTLLNNKVRNLEHLASKENEILLKEKSLQDKERNLELDILKEKIKFTETNYQNIRQLAEIVFKNRVLTYSKWSSTEQRDPHNFYNRDNVTSSETLTVTKDK